MPLVNLITCSCFVLILFLSGCSPDHQYRTRYTLCALSEQSSCDDAALIHYNEDAENAFDLAFIEFDDQGQLRDRLQMESVMNAYTKIAATQKVIVAVFAHGWHHSAAPDDTNVASFANFLERLSEIEHQTSNMDHRDERRVLGVYIGWRGDSTRLPIATNLSFWGRKNTAHQVGLYGVAEVLLRLEELSNTRYSSEEQQNRMVVIGHSFGGALMFTGLQQILADRYINSYPGKNYAGHAHGFADLVVLMNPAFEAMRYATLYDLGQNCYHKEVVSEQKKMACRAYLRSQKPRFAILTSEADMATRKAFPAGRFFSTLFETHNHVVKHRSSDTGPTAFLLDENDADNTAVGHYEPFHTHRLLPWKKTPQRGDDYDYRNLLTLWEEQNTEGTINFEKTQLVHLGNSDPHNPYMNVYVDKTLIPDHNQIWGDDIVRFLHDLITISTLPEPAMENFNVP